MGEQKRVACPECQGNKIVAGSCVCNHEWRGTQTEEHADDCQCNDDEPCPICNGKGYILE